MDNGTMFVIGGAVVISIISFMVYAVLAFFFPEWVGITGKVALSAEQSHGEGKEAPEHMMDKF